jgi:Hypoxia induced protein conserved region
MSNTLIVILLVAAMGATVFMLVRGVVAFLKTTEAELNSKDAGPSASSMKQNKAMFGRIVFQGVAVLLVALLLLMRGNGN